MKYPLIHIKKRLYDLLKKTMTQWVSYYNEIGNFKSIDKCLSKNEEDYYGRLSEWENRFSGNIIYQEYNNLNNKPTKTIEPIPIIDITNLFDYFISLDKDIDQRDKIYKTLNLIPPFDYLIFKIFKRIMLLRTHLIKDLGCWFFELFIIDDINNNLFLKNKMLRGKIYPNDFYLCADFIETKETKDLITAMNLICITLSLIHFKGLEITINCPKDKLNIHRENENKEPFDKYYVLNLNPFKKHIKYIARKNKQSKEMALHWIMEHSKDYTEGNGLFGKHHDVFIWHKRLLGNKNIGVINKDYKFSSPFEQIIEDNKS